MRNTKLSAVFLLLDTNLNVQNPQEANDDVKKFNCFLLFSFFYLFKKKN